MARLAFFETIEFIDEDALSRYLHRRGFSPTAPGCWQRGRRHAWLSISPERWPARLEQRGRDLSLRIRARGQVLTRAELAFWEREWQVLCQAAAGRPVQVAGPEQRRDLAIVENLLVQLGALMMGAVAGLTVGASTHPAAGLLAFLCTTAALLALGLLWLRWRPDGPAQPR